MLHQSKQRIDHVAIAVFRENLGFYVQKFSALLGIEFDDIIHSEESNVSAALSWDAGLEIIAPLTNEGYFWDRLQRFGEGVPSLVFGVADMNMALARVHSMGITHEELRFNRRSFPWLDRFEFFREAMLKQVFPPYFVLDLTLSEIVPRDKSTPADQECKFYYGIDD